jgi:hypothetical protein
MSVSRRHPIPCGEGIIYRLRSSGNQALIARQSSLSEYLRACVSARLSICAPEYLRAAIASSAVNNRHLFALLSRIYVYVN